MSVEDFELLCQETGILHDGLCTTQQARLCYNLAIFTQVDELTNDRHQRATLVEFMEAMVRVLEKASLSPLGVPEEEALSK